MVRLVRSPAGVAVIDASAVAPGRGAYVCRRRECASGATGRGVLARALRAALDPADLATLRREIEREMA
jgi:predicted RNA-binding protein YlxR (DUF448 family)